MVTAIIAAVGFAVSLVSMGIKASDVSDAQKLAEKDAAAARADVLRASMIQQQQRASMGASAVGAISVAYAKSGLSGGASQSVALSSVEAQIARERNQMDFETKISLLDIDRELQSVKLSLKSDLNSSLVRNSAEAFKSAATVVTSSVDVKAANDIAKADKKASA